MSLDSAQKMQLNSVTHSVRASQAVLQYGVGAMVDFPDQTLMTAAPEYWKERVIQIHDERLEKVLHVDYFGMPGSKDDIRFKEGISYARFPEWYFCPKCRAFKPIGKWIEDYKRKANARAQETDPNMVKHMRCPTCRQELVVARIITVCEHGHIDDFPWVKWVHSQSWGGPKDICAHPSLTFKTGASATEGLEGLIISCTFCGAKTSLKGAFDPTKFQEIDRKTSGKYDFSCTGRHPWKHTKEACGHYPQAKQRGSSSVYFPVTESSLVIPPYSSILTTKIENSNAFSRCKDSLNDMLRMPGLTQELKDSFINMQIIQYSGEIALEIGVPKEQIQPVLERKWRSENDDEYSTTSLKYRAEEYDALNGALSFGIDSHDDFQRESTHIEDYNLPYIKRISLINKIREVQALTGFSRIRPADPSEPAGAQVNVVSVKQPETNWYPAYEVRGEGIFIELDDDAIDTWRTQNAELQKRVDILNENYRKSFIGSTRPRVVTSKFVLLHTLAHLLIKQLSFECGYSIASLKERIYCSDTADGKIMSGILIYTASGDSEGTMGGLVRQGRHDTFPSIFRKAIESAMTCSNDPVCSLSQGQGRDSLNLSACYSCTLIPETSCEEFNVFLDRGMVIGTFDKPELGFFYEQLYGNGSWASVVNASGSPVTHQIKKQILFIPGAGTDMSDVSYKSIWENILQWVDDKAETSLLKELKDNDNLFLNKEKPMQNCTFILSDGTDQYQCDLIWKHSKVAYFSSDNEDAYLLAMNSDWHCFWGNDASLKPDIIAAAIKERS